MADAEDSYSLGRQSTRAEARGLYRILGQDGNTLEELRELIAVPPKIERVLRAYMKAHPEEAHGVEGGLKFRQSVCARASRLPKFHKSKNRSWRRLRNIMPARSRDRGTAKAGFHLGAALVEIVTVRQVSRETPQRSNPANQAEMSTAAFLQ